MMMKKETLKISLLTLLFVAYSCGNKPKEVKPTNNEIKKTEVFSKSEDDLKTKGDSNDLHQVKVNEILPADQYIYLNVTEGDKAFWIATRKMEVEKGKTYSYRGGLLKKNFESKEYKRTFETIYLVSSLVESNHSQSVQLKKDTNEKVDISTHTDEIIPRKGSIKISELVKNPKKYEGKTVQITGKCVKINPYIMQRNWIHLQDGSKNDFDLVITSRAYVSEGSIVTIKARVSLDKDFGAGYRYDLILEDGVVIQ